MLDTAQVEKAVRALVAHIKKRDEESNDLIEDDHVIWLSLGMKNMPQVKAKQHRIKLPHSLLSGRDVDTCLFTKDPQKEYKEKLVAGGITKISKVIGVSKLRANYKQFEAKRKLCSSYDLFLADDRIIPLLPKLLGKTFFDKKKQPIPVNLTRKNLRLELSNAMSSTYLNLGTGTSCAIKVASTAHSVDEIVANINHAAAQVAEIIPKKWKNVQSFHIKTSDSIALPIFNSLPEAPSRITVDQ